MKTYGFNIGEQNHLQRVSNAQAKYQYQKGDVIYVKVSSNMWLSVNIKDDGEFEDFSAGTQFFIDTGYDEDKVIVSRHQCVIDFFKSRGVNARVVPVARLNDVIDKTVYTTSCPLHLISFAKDAFILNVKDVGELEFDDLTLEDIEKSRYQTRHYIINSKRVNEWSNIPYED